MPDHRGKKHIEQKYSEGNNDFITERIKVKPVNKRKLIRRTITTITMAVIFGLVACVTFLILEPVISNWLYPKEEPQPEIVMFPEDRDEMLPEDMLAENLPTESPESASGPDSDTGPEGASGEEPGQETDPEADPEEDRVELAEDQIEEILAGVVLDLENYKELYSAMSEYVTQLSRCMVNVTAVSSNIDWFNDVQENRNQCPGLILSDNGMELLVLADYTPIASAERLLLTFYNGVVVEGHLKKQNRATNLAVLSVELAALPEGMNEGLPRAVLGYSNGKNLPGTPVVALGRPMGSSNSVGYGMITSSNTTLSMTDRNYKLIQTDINGSQNAGGVLFDLEGQVVGIITNGKTGSDMRNVITAYGITELRRIVEKMSNASSVAYMGIRGVDVPRESISTFST